MRGPARVASGSGDLKAIYLPSRAWLRGLDPYDQEVLARMWIDAGGEERTAPAHWGAPSVYPPTALAMLSPLSALPWRFAQPIWCGLNLAALAVLLICMHQLAGVQWFEARSLCMIAIMLAFEPVSTTIALGQPSIIVAALAAASIVAGTRGGDSRSGLLEGFAIGLKPQLAIAFAAPYVLARWRYSAVVAATVLMVGCIALMRLASDNQWIANYLANLHFAFGPGGANDAGPSNPNRIEFINLGYLFSLFLTSRSLSEGLAWAVGLSLALAGLKELGRRPTGVMLLECMALLAAVELLVFYHKAYDAVVLAFPMAWALSPAVPIRRSWPVLLTLGCYILPGGVAVQVLGQSHYVSRAVSSSVVWQTLILPYQAWAVLVIALWLGGCVLRAEMELT